MELRTATASLALAEEFGIARGSRTTQSVVQLELEHDGIVGRGEAAPVYYRGESIESAADFLTSTAPPLVGDDLFALEAIEGRVGDVDGEAAGKAALDAALHDWIGKRLGVPLWRLLGLSPEAPPTSYTIGIDSLDGTRDRARERASSAPSRSRSEAPRTSPAWRPCARSRPRHCGWTPTRAGRSSPRAS